MNCGLYWLLRIYILCNAANLQNVHTHVDSKLYCSRFCFYMLLQIPKMEFQIQSVKFLNPNSRSYFLKRTWLLQGLNPDLKDLAQYNKNLLPKQTHTQNVNKRWTYKIETRWNPFDYMEKSSSANFKNEQSNKLSSPYKGWWFEHKEKYP